MVRNFWIVMIACVLCVPVFGVSLGPPKATLPQGDFSVGVDVSHHKIDVDVDSVSVNGISNDTAALLVNYGIFSDVTLTGIIGAGQIDHKQFDAETGIVVGGGVAATFIDELVGNNALSFGGVAQIIYQAGTIETPAPTPGYWKRFLWWKRWVNLPQYPSVIESDFAFTTFILAAGPTYETGKLTVYGGPLLAYIEGSVELPYDTNVGVEEKTRAGVYVGGSYAVAENVTVGLDYVTTGAVQTLGVSGSFKF